MPNLQMNVDQYYAAFQGGNPPPAWFEGEIIRTIWKDPLVYPEGYLATTGDSPWSNTAKTIPFGSMIKVYINDGEASNEQEKSDIPGS